jgi:hypothetical protein
MGRLTARVGFGIALLLVACADPPATTIELPVLGLTAADYAGKWYTSDSLLDLEILINPGTAPLARFREPTANSYRLVAIAAQYDGLLFTLQGPEEVVTSHLRAIQAPERQPPGCDLILMGHHYWLFREPSTTWLISGAVQRRLGNAAKTTEGLVDHLVRAL